jgi:hypothetical protein
MHLLSVRQQPNFPPSLESAEEQHRTPRLRRARFGPPANLCTKHGVPLLDILGTEKRGATQYCRVERTWMSPRGGGGVNRRFKTFTSGLKNAE